MMFEVKKQVLKFGSLHFEVEMLTKLTPIK